jgi:predicted  nucleic acid-binding Zn-ribbon protein
LQTNYNLSFNKDLQSAELDKWISELNQVSIELNETSTLLENYTKEITDTKSEHELLITTLNEYKIDSALAEQGTTLFLSTSVNSSKLCK